MSPEVHSVQMGELLKWPEGSFMEQLKEAEFMPMMASAASGLVPVSVRSQGPSQFNWWVQQSAPRFTPLVTTGPLIHWNEGLFVPDKPKRPAWLFLAGALANFAMVVANIVLFALHLTGPWTGALAALNVVVGCWMFNSWAERWGVRTRIGWTHSGNRLHLTLGSRPLRGYMQWRFWGGTGLGDAAPPGSRWVIAGFGDRYKTGIRFTRYVA